MHSARTIILILLSVCLAGTGCGGFRFDSAWKAREISIDGKDDEWQDSMAREKGVFLAAANDADFLYLCLSATDKMTKAQMMGLFRQSFTVWFDPRGGKQRSFGLRFINESPFMEESLVRKIRFLKTPEFQVVADEMIKNLVIEIVRNDYPVAVLADARGIDVAVAIAMQGRKLTYELRIPLGRSAEHPFAIETAPGRVVGVGIETSPIDLAEMLGVIERTGRGFRVSAAHSIDGALAEPVAPVGVWGRLRLAKAVAGQGSAQ